MPIESQAESGGSPRPSALVLDADQASASLCASVLQEEGFDVALRAGAGTYDLMVCEASLVPETLGRVNAAAMVVLTPPDAADAGPAAGGRWPTLQKPVEASRLTRAVTWAMHQGHLARGEFSPVEMEALYRIATLANSEANLPALLSDVLEVCLSALGADFGSVMLASATGRGPRTLSIVASRGLSPQAESAPVPFGHRVAGWVAAQRRPLRLVGSLSAYPQFAGLDSKDAVGESLVAPLSCRNEVLGVINVGVERGKRLGPEKLALLVSAADVAAAAVFRSKLEQTRAHQDKMAMLGQLSASMAHELNNPLSYVSANVETLVSMVAEGADPKEVVEILKETQEGIGRMVALIGNLKSASRKAGSQVQRVDLNALCRSAEGLVQPQFKHRLTFVRELAELPEVDGNGGQVLQVLINLLVNAGQAIEQRGRIALRTRQEGDWAVVEVEDDGPGIPEEVAGQLFQPFFTTKPEGEGTGLGLSISRQIAVEHGGSLTFTSTVGKGTCFQFRLPLPRAAAVAAPSWRPVVLAVDDSAGLLRAMVRTLERAFDVVGAESAKEALALAQTRTFDLVLTDYSMPEQDGLSLVRQLKKGGLKAPCALVTAVAEDGEIESALKSGELVRVIPKPWSPSALVATALGLLAKT